MTPETEGGNFENYPSQTYKIRVGCGNLYVTICCDDKRRFKRLFIPRNSKFYCPVTTRDAIAKLSTYEGKRNLKQLVKDLRGDKFGHYCDKYNITSQATSCFDAVSQIIDRWQRQKRKRKLHSLSQ